MKASALSLLTGVAFLAASFPAFAQAEPKDIFVTKAGNDATGDGTAGNPYLTIGKAFTGALNGDTVHVGAGTYTEGVQVPDGVMLIGEGFEKPGATIINGDTPFTDGRVSVGLGTGSVIESCVIRRSAVATAQPILVAYIDDGSGGKANLDADGGVENCLLDGLGSNGSVGMYAEGGTRDDIELRDCHIVDVETGVRAFDSGINITRCRFDGVTGNCIEADTLLKQSGETVPLMGLKGEPELTGYNQMRDVAGQFVVNSTNTLLEAQNNDWGLYTFEAIDAKLTGPTNRSFCTTAGIGAGTIVVSLLDANNNVIPDSAAPVCLLNGQPGQRDQVCLDYLFANQPPNVQQQVQASATGFGSQSTQATASGLNVTAIAVRLAPGSGNNGNGFPNCGKDGALAYAGGFVIVAGAGWRRRRCSRTGRR